MSSVPEIERRLRATLPLEFAAHAGELAQLLAGIVDGTLTGETVQSRISASPILGAALAVLAGRSIRVDDTTIVFSAGQPDVGVIGNVSVQGDVRILQHITVTGGTVTGSIIGSIDIAVTHVHPPAPPMIDPIEAQAHLAALPLDVVPDLAPLLGASRMPWQKGLEPLPPERVSSQRRSWRKVHRNGNIVKWTDCCYNTANGYGITWAFWTRVPTLQPSVWKVHDKT